jgi:class 3 adenylate cyclase
MLQALEKKGYSVNATKKPNAVKTDTISGANLSTAIDQLEEQSDRLEALSRQAEQKQDFQTLASLRDQLAELEQDRLELEIIQREKNLLTQDMRIAELTLKAREEELARESRLRKALIGGSLFLTTFLISIGFLYSAKRKDHKKLTIAYGNLDVANHKLSEAESRIKTLLNQQVSGVVARELIQSQSDHPSKNKYVCIMFLDIRDFTPTVEGMSPEQIIQYQNHVFGSMIEIVDRYKGIINQFMGDGFMATFGVPQSRGNDCQHAYDAALEIIETVNRKSDKHEIPDTRLGIGLHAGNVVTGNVGTAIRKQYSITGTTVIIASRLEQLNKLFGTQLILSYEVFKHLDHPPKNQELKSVNVKGVKEKLEIIAIG